MTPVKEGCNVSTTLVDTSASPKVLSSTSVRRASRCCWQTLSLLSPLSHQASLSSHGCFQATRGSLSPARPSAVQPGLLLMSRTSAEVRSAGPNPHSPSQFSYKMTQSTVKVPLKISLSFFTALHQHTEMVPRISASSADKILKREIGVCQQELSTQNIGSK